jgi:hypothetical protein
MGVIEVKYFNSFVLKKVMGNINGTDSPIWNGSKGGNTYDNTAYVPNPAVIDSDNWAVEEARIRGGYNNTSVEPGVKAYLVENEPNASFRVNSMIYSGIFNSRTGINDTNVFSVGDDIVKSVDPANGSIQKIYAEDTNLIIFQESKVSRALIDKDAIYTAEGGQLTTLGNVVIGAVTAYVGNFGISKNPGSFATYGRRKYFTDKDRNAVLRLSNDGLTEISNYGMSDYFRDQLSSLDNDISSVGKAIGGWDIHNKQYSLSLQPFSGSFSTLSFDDSVNGFPSFFTYKPDQSFSLKNNFYTMKEGVLYKHYTANRSGLTPKRGSFYGTTSPSSVTFLFNPKVSMSKVFKTVNYEGSNGWQVNSFTSDITGNNLPNTLSSVDNTQDVVGSVDAQGNTLPIKVYSYNQGSYDNFGNEYGTGTTQLIPPINHAGFTRKENKYMANLINNSPAAAGEVVWGDAMTGIKGYFATVKMSTDSVTDVGGMKELFAASSQYVESSY